MAYHIDSPTIASTRGILYIPGASGEALTERLKHLKDEAIANGYYLLRFESWKDGAGLGERTIAQIHSELDTHIAKLQEKGCTQIMIAAKSLGGAFVLTYKNPLVSCISLWSPAVWISEHESLTTFQTQLLGSLQELEDLQIDATLAKTISVPVQIIQGTHDKVVSWENAKKMSLLLPQCNFQLIENMDHSYTGFMDVVAARTIQFFNNPKKIIK